MSKKTITAPLNKDPAELVASVRELARHRDASFEGDALSGNFSAQGVSGEYRITDREVVIEIRKKPLLLPWSVVERKVRAFFTA